MTIAIHSLLVDFVRCTTALNFGLLLMIRISPLSSFSRSSGGKLDLIHAELNRHVIFKLLTEPFKVLSITSKLCSSLRNGTSEEARMASIPFATHSASKIHEHMKAKFTCDEETHEEPPTTKLFWQNSFGIDAVEVLTNYNSKLMNSIWGQYNLYAAHAFQKNNESAAAEWDVLNIPQVKNLWDILRTAHQ